MELLSTARDVIDIIPQLYDTEESLWVRTISQIKNAIYLQDGQLRGALRLQYGTDLTCTPWASYPTADTENSGTKSLLEVTVSTSAITETWTLTFTSTTAYTIEGDISGSQGTGSTATDSSSTNGYITMVSTKWSGTAASGDKVYIRVYNVEAALVDMSSKFAAAYVLDTIYTQEVPNASEASERWRSDAQASLEKYLDAESGWELGVGFVSRDLSPSQVLPRYIISDLGEDLSDYADGPDD